MNSCYQSSSMVTYTDYSIKLLTWERDFINEDLTFLLFSALLTNPSHRNFKKHQENKI